MPLPYNRFCKGVSNSESQKRIIPLNYKTFNMSHACQNINFFNKIIKQFSLFNQIKLECYNYTCIMSQP